MPFYVADYLADTTHLSTVEHGAYLLLIMNYWQHKGLPGEPGRMARICRMSQAEWLEIAETLAELFGPGWTHKRIDDELARSDTLIARRKAAGKAGADARYGKRRDGEEPTQPQSDRQTQPHSESDSQPESLSASQSKAPSGAPAQAASGRRRRDDFERLEGELREAAGLEGEPAIALKDLSPIYALLDKGYDLASDILPKLRAAKATGKRPSSWRYFLPAIEEGKAANNAIRPKPLMAVVAPVVFVSLEDRRWPELAERYRREHGRDPPTIAGPGGMGRHWPGDWVEAVPARRQRRR